MEGVLEADGGVAGQCEGTQCHWTIHLKYLKMVTLISVYFNTIILKGWKDVYPLKIWILGEIGLTSKSLLP